MCQIVKYNEKTDENRYMENGLFHHTRDLTFRLPISLLVFTQNSIRHRYKGGITWHMSTNARQKQGVKRKIVKFGAKSRKRTASRH
jgi:hypothetical protein